CRGPRRVAAPSAARARGRSRRRPPARIVGPMKLRTVLSLLRSGELGLLLSATGAMRRHHRLVFLAAGTSSGLFARLAKGPVPLNRLADGLLADPSMRDGLEAWLRVGVVPRAGPVRLLEIGCGSAVYIRHAAGRNPELTALGLELQPEVAALAAENVSAWGLARRVAIEAGDVMARAAEAAFDLATLHNN